jgi:hypothetical protein
MSKNTVDILEKNIPKRKEVSLASFSLLSIALIQYNLQRASGIQELEDKFVFFTQI